MNQKRALLAVSFGTSYPETARKTIGAVEQDLSAAFPGLPVYRAWTSGFIRRKIAERDGVRIPSLEEALAQMLQDGIREILVQPTFMLEGIEYDELTESLGRHRAEFDQILLGRPLLARERDLDSVVDAVHASFPEVKAGEALVLMGHGTRHGANHVYPQLAELFRSHGYGNVYLGTVEAVPGLAEVLEGLDAQKPEKVYLAPFLFVAGDHAEKDLAGSGPDSWNSVICAKGYRTECRKMGLGEYRAVRRMYVEHAREAEPL